MSAADDGGIVLGALMGGAGAPAYVELTWRDLAAALGERTDGHVLGREWQRVQGALAYARKLAAGMGLTIPRPLTENGREWYYRLVDDVADALDAWYYDLGDMVTRARTDVAQQRVHLATATEPAELAYLTRQLAVLDGMVITLEDMQASLARFRSESNGAVT